MQPEYVSDATYRAIQSNPLTAKAFEIAERKHRGKTRKYSTDPYITHPIAVFETLALFTDDPDLLSAALVHDVPEDTDYDIENLKEDLNDTVYILVLYVTNPVHPAGMTKIARKRANNAHTLSGIDFDKRVGWLKCADIENNIKDMPDADPLHAQFYIPLKREFVNNVEDIPKPLRERLEQAFQNFFNRSSILG